MSRSYKKTPGYKVGMPDYKKFSSKENRHDPDLPEYGGFQKNGYQYDICEDKDMYYYGTDDYKAKMK